MLSQRWEGGPGRGLDSASREAHRKLACHRGCPGQRLTLVPMGGSMCPKPLQPRPGRATQSKLVSRTKKTHGLLFRVPSPRDQKQRGGQKKGRHGCLKSVENGVESHPHPPLVLLKERGGGSWGICVPCFPLASASPRRYGFPLGCLSKKAVFTLVSIEKAKRVPPEDKPLWDAALDPLQRVLPFAGVFSLPRNFVSCLVDTRFGEVLETLAQTFHG